MLAIIQISRSNTIILTSMIIIIIIWAPPVCRMLEGQGDLRWGKQCGGKTMNSFYQCFYIDMCRLNWAAILRMMTKEIIRRCRQNRDYGT